MSKLPSLLAWLHTFEDVEGAMETAQDLSDGVALCEIMHQIAPNYFDSDTLSKISRNVKGNTRLKISNIKKLKRSIGEFYEALDTLITSLNLPEDADVEQGDNESLCTLIELLVGCAVHCESKEQHITTIVTSLPDRVKADLMAIIQNMIDLVASSSSSPTSSSLLSTATSANAAMTSLSRQITENTHNSVPFTPSRGDKFDFQELNKHYNELKSKYDALVIEHDNEVEKQQITIKTQSQQFIDSLKSSHNKQITELQDTIRSLTLKLEDSQQEFEHEKSDLTLEIEKQNKENARLRNTIEKLSSSAANIQSLKDEIEELSHQAAKVSQYERKIEAYEAKLEILRDAQSQMQGIENEREELLRKISQLEQENQKSISIKSQLDTLKRQHESIMIEKLEESKRGDKAQFELQQIRKNLADVEKERDKLRQEKEILQQEISDNKYDSMTSLSSSLEQSSDTSILKNKIKKLEEEIIRLRSSSLSNSATTESSSSSQDHDLHHLLEAANAFKETLTNENRQQSLRILELESQLSAPSANATTTNDLIVHQLATCERDLKLTTERLAQSEGREKKLHETQQQLQSQLTLTQNSLIQLKKEQSLMGLDQQALISAIKQQSQQEFEEIITKSNQRISELEKEIATLSQSAKESSLSTSSQISLLQSKLEKTSSELAICEKSLKEKTEQVTTILLEKDQLLSKFLAISESGTVSGGLEKTVLELKLQLSESEKQSMEANNRIFTLSSELKAIQNALHDQVENNAKLHDLLSSGSLNSAQDSSSLEELRLKVEDAEKELKFEQGQREALKERYEKEIKLMTTAWYELGMQYQRLAAKQSDRGAPAFLPAQRQAALAAKQ